MNDTASLDAANLNVDRRKEDRIPFGGSICVRVSDNTKREVKSVRGACEVLIDWPHSRRGPVYQATMEVLQSAISGKVSPEAARDAFVDFAKHANVLVT